MQNTRRKTEQLDSFIKKFFELDPMGLCPKNGYEYEAESLSILARFSEAGVHFAETKDAAMPVALGIVSEVMQFWFDSQDLQDQEQVQKWHFITNELLDIYLNV